MAIQLTSTLEERREYAERVRSVAGMLCELLEQYARTASALWDLRELDGHSVLTLALSSPWGYASANFALEEVAPTNDLRKRLNDLVGEMIASSHRERIEIRDVFATAEFPEFGGG